MKYSAEEAVARIQGMRRIWAAQGLGVNKKSPSKASADINIPDEISDEQLELLKRHLTNRIRGLAI
jgi:hypothetical protein